MLPSNNNILFESLENTLLDEKGVRLTIARLDKIHPIVSGNKLFKLYYFILEALTSGKTIYTFGGAYSNHLVATSYACREAGVKCTGFIRGEEEARSHTIAKCLEYGMEIRFVKRNEYYELQEDPGKKSPYILIPEGGYHPLGAKGASLIMDYVVGIGASHVCTPVGTATTVAGLIQNKGDFEIIAVPVIKNMTDLEKRINFLNGDNTASMPLVLDAYHFGGYAKSTPQLLDFMNYLYKTYSLATDFVYTGKMMFAIFDRIRKDYFPYGSHIVCIHTGGLQGNLSLPGNSLIF